MSMFGNQKSDSNEATVELTFSGIKTVKGQLLISLHNESGFPDQENKAIKNLVVEVKQSKININIEGLLPGSYAISVVHDENKNFKLDKNMLGVPKEGYGFSNNPSAKFGAPSFSESKFVLLKSEIKKLEIKMIYW